MSKNNIISFDSNRNNKTSTKPNAKPNVNQEAKEILERSAMIDLGTIFIDLYMDADGTGISMLPSYSLSTDINEELIDDIANMLKANFDVAIDQLLKNFKESIN